MPSSARNDQPYGARRFKFPASIRLLRAEEYSRVFAQARRISTTGLVLLYRSNGMDGNRLGLAISKKHVRKAVQRNTIKRLVREIFRLRQLELTGIDIVMLSRTPLAVASREQVQRQLGQLWEKLSNQGEN